MGAFGRLIRAGQAGVGAARGLAGIWDYFKSGGGQDAAEEATESARQATQSAFDRADQRYTQGRGDVDAWRNRMLGGYNSQGSIADVERAMANGATADQARAAFGPQWDPGVIQNAANQQQGNVDAWWQDYQNRGGAYGQAQDMLNDPRYNQGITAAFDALGGMGSMQDEYAKARKEGYGQLDFIKDRQGSLAQRYGDAKQEARDTMDIAGMEEDRAALRQEFVQNTGGRQILGAVQGSVMARDQALADLDSQRGTMSPQQFAQMKKAINDQYNSQIVMTSAKEYDRINTEWLNSEAVSQKTIADARGTLTNALSNLTIAEGQEGTALAASGQGLVNSIVNSINGEADYVTKTVNTALGASQFALNTLWQAIGADENARKFAMVDAPNTIIDAAKNDTLRVEAGYIDSLFRVQGAADQFAAMGLNFQYEFSPTVANLSDFLIPAQQGMNDAWNSYTQAEQMDMANAAQSQQNTLGMWGIGSRMFDFGFGGQTAGGMNWGVRV